MTPGEKRQAGLRAYMQTRPDLDPKNLSLKAGLNETYVRDFLKKGKGNVLTHKFKQLLDTIGFTDEQLQTFGTADDNAESCPPAATDQEPAKGRDIFSKAALLAVWDQLDLGQRAWAIQTLISAVPTSPAGDVVNISKTKAKRTGSRRASK